MNKLFIGVLIFFLFSCQSNSDQDYIPINSTFVELSPEHHGIDFQNILVFQEDLNIIEYLYFNNGGGVAVGDVNNDGLEDVIFTANLKSDELYLNKGSLKFENHSTQAGLSKSNSWSSGVVIDDVNGDGWKDIYICKVAPVSPLGTKNELYINQRDGSFKEQAEDYGLAFSGYSTQASFFDYDNDGDLDMYLLNHSIHSTKSYGPISKRQEKDSLSGDLLFENRLNDSEQRFVDVTKKAGIYSSAIGYGLGVITSDINNDGWIDIYVGNDFHDNDYLYLNQGDGTFKESANQLLTHTSQFSMGVDVADINGDGHMDIFTTDMMPYDASIMMKSGGNDSEQIVKIKKDFGYLTQYSRNMLQLNEGNSRFSEQAHITRTFATDWSWSVLIQDFNNNGLSDIFISNGILNRPNDLDYIQYINTPENRKKENESLAQFNQRVIEQMPTLKIPNLLFQQESGLKFTSPSNSFIGKPNYSNGAAYADFDKDGDLDIVTNNVNGPISFLKNETAKANFISFQLPEKNTLVKVKTSTRDLIKEYTTTRGYQSSSSHYLHFGLDDQSSNVDVEIIWKDGARQTLNNVSVNQYLKVEKKLETEGLKDQKTTENKDFVLSVIPIVHKENDYDDLDQEPLMPYKLSQKGPAALIEDFDNDGIKDFYLGGAAGNQSQYFKATGNNSWKKEEKDVFSLDSRLEDVDAVVLDFNQDGFKDIYVVSGGNQYNQQSQELQDRIYINDQKGGFYRLEISLPMTNGSCIAIADFDNDGYEDFFVGAQNVPGGFGVSPVSFIIKNIKGQRLEIAAKLRAGMVNDAKWKDLDNDGKPELILVGDWMPIKVFSYKEEGFIDVSEELGLPNIRGLFESVEIGDFNTDGKPDFALGNIGLNTSFQLDGDERINLLISDYDENTFPDPIIFKGYFNETVPFSDKMTLKSQMPVINKLFPTYNKFSDFRSIDQLNVSKKEVDEKYINTLASILILSGEDGYKMIDLPREAQISNISDLKWIKNEEGGDLWYVGNSKNNSHALGQNIASSGGVFSDFDFEKNNFISHTRLGLPIGTVARKVIHYDKDRSMIIVNDGRQYIVERK